MARRKSEEVTAPLWFVSYADLVTNMLCFFVMLFAFSSLDSPKQRMQEQSRDERHWVTFSINSATGAHQWLGEGGPGMVFAPARRKHDMPKIARNIRDKLRKASLSDRIRIRQNDQMVKIHIPSGVLFQSGSARMTEESEEVLMALLPVISTVDNFIRVDGHTDDIPIGRGGEYPSNWELSASRACSVVRFYTEQMNQSPTRFSAQGFGEFRPTVPNITDKDRETNRRVEIIILSNRVKERQELKWE